ncbi:MAG: O-antigen ligase family protein [Clostridiales bacterium]|nr:O-antigen ligase family protein [Clostridiales bacterium]
MADFFRRTYRKLMKESIRSLKEKYHRNPGWYWLMAIIFLFPILPEYVSPFILFAGFIVFKVQWSREGRKANVGTIGKLMMIFMLFSVISTFWSDTKFSTFAIAMLWWGMFLVEVMIYNLARTRRRIDKIFSLMAASGALNGIIAVIQICTYTLYKYEYIEKSQVLTTPFYKFFDKKVYTWLPFEIDTTLWWDSRASGFFSNPNLLVTYLLLVYPISIYLFLNRKGKKHKIIYFMTNVFISCGISATLTRAGCIIAIAGWLFIFIILIKQHWKPLLQIFIPTVCVIVPSLLTRYGIIFKSRGNGEEAKESSAVHFQIYESLIDYIFNHVQAFLVGLGFGCESTGAVLLNEYNLDKPHGHNFILETWMEIGIIGVIMLFVVLIFAFGKLLEINANNGKKFTLVFCVLTSMLLYLLFGLTDYIFNSPKQIILLFILLGLTQAISNCYNKTIIHDAHSLKEAAEQEIQNATHQKAIRKK